MSVSAAKTIRGDFQTPPALAARVCELLAARGVCPSVVLEPTCGTGAFLRAGVATWGAAPAYFGFDIEPEYVTVARANLPPDVRVSTRDFFAFDWDDLVRGLPEGRLLFLGNPPWVTNAGLGVLGGDNLPQKTNSRLFTGLEAKTGKSNFDISEWMILRLIDAGLAAGRVFDVAMLCKTGTARKILEGAWRHGLPVTDAALYRIDAGQWFGAAVEASLFFATFGAKKIARGDPSASPSGGAECQARCYTELRATASQSVIGYAGGSLIADYDAYEAIRHLQGGGTYRWRSGVKHDLANVCELRRGNDGTLRNGFGDVVDIEDERVFPLLKCTDVFHGTEPTERCVLLSQLTAGENTDGLRERLPRTWAYLTRYADLFAARKSSIYKKQHAFALFGIGEYTLAPYKVAVSGLHKDVRFRLVGPWDGKPVVFDDTCYFVGRHTEAEAQTLLSRCESDEARQSIKAYLFADAKRPVTAELLHRLPL